MGLKLATVDLKYGLHRVPKTLHTLLRMLTPLLFIPSVVLGVLVKRIGIMEKFKRFLNSIAAFFSGMVLSSLWFTGSDTWKIHLPIVLLCIVLRMFLDEEK